MEEIKYGKLTLLDEGYSYTITDCEKDATEVEIPAKVDGKHIRAIGHTAFDGCKELKSVIFPEYTDEDYMICEVMEEIEGNAFMGCTSLTELSLPQSIVTIGHGAFYGCTSLTTIDFNKNAYIAPYAFVGCSSLVNLPRVTNVSEGSFSECDSLTFLPIEDGITEICEETFARCKSLVEVVIPASVERIEGLAFRSCMSLKRVVFESAGIWYTRNRYFEGLNEVDVSDPEKNARMLATMDFDDGVVEWCKSRRG